MILSTSVLYSIIYEVFIY